MIWEVICMITSIPNAGLLCVEQTEITASHSALETPAAPVEWPGAQVQIFGGLSNASRALEKSENGLLTQQLISQSEADV